MKSLKTLLKLTIKSLKKGEKEGYYNYGLCGEISDMYAFEDITKEECDVVKRFIEINKPSAQKHGEFTKKSMHWINEHFWWETMQDMPETRQVRIDFLTKLLNELPTN